MNRPPRPSREQLLSRRAGELAEEIKTLKAENKRRKRALEEIIIESGKVDIANWPMQQQICQAIAQQALKEQGNDKA